MEINLELLLFLQGWCFSPQKIKSSNMSSHYYVCWKNSKGELQNCFYKHDYLYSACCGLVYPALQPYYMYVHKVIGLYSNINSQWWMWSESLSLFCIFSSVSFLNFGYLGQMVLSVFLNQVFIYWVNIRKLEKRILKSDPWEKGKEMKSQ